MVFEKTNDYLSKKFKILSSGHLIINSHVNGIAAKLIIDTGASNSCIDSNKIEAFKIEIENYDEQASSATEKIKKMYISEENSIDIAGFSIENLKLFVFDMGHINETLKENEPIKVHGIIGNDIMSKHEAIISFSEKKIYLKLNL